MFGKFGESDGRLAVVIGNHIVNVTRSAVGLDRAVIAWDTAPVFQVAREVSIVLQFTLCLFVAALSTVVNDLNTTLGIIRMRITLTMSSGARGSLC